MAQLIAYSLDELDSQTRAAVEQQLGEQPSLRLRLADVQDALCALRETGAEAADWRVDVGQKAALRELFAPRGADWLQAAADRVREWVAQRVTHLMPGTNLVPGYRSGAAASHLTYVCDEVEVDIRLSCPPEHEATTEVGVLGFVSSDEIADSIVATALTTRVETRLSLNPSGEFDGRLVVGVYEMRIVFPSRTVVIPRIDLTPDADESDAC